MADPKEFRNNIAASLFISPCSEIDLKKREFLDGYAMFWVQRAIMDLELRGAVYYRDNVIYVKKKWAKENLQEYDLDFRTKKEKLMDGMSDFKISVLKKLGKL